MSKRFGLNVARSAGGERANNTWCALLSDSESETEVPATPLKKSAACCGATVPAAPKKPAADLMAGLEDMFRGDLLWGDLMLEEFSTSASVSTPDPEPILRGSEEEFWAGPWSAKLHEQNSDVYDTTELTDVEYNGMMSWLYEKGWWVGDFERSWVSFEPDNMPSRRWCPLSDELPRKVVHFGPSCCHKKEKKAASPSDAGAAPILRFCRSTECTEEGCRYVHGDTIPRVDRPCAFGERCGAADPTGMKRSQCLYMHPGETWSADLVIRRPAAVATPEPSTSA
jgi:hypothetical protein